MAAVSRKQLLKLGMNGEKGGATGSNNAVIFIARNRGVGAAVGCLELQGD